MRLSNKVIVAILLLLSGKTLNSQINTIKFEHFTSKEGLSQSTVKCIQQDKMGFLWFGTLKGLNKFDGLEFTTYNHDTKDSTSLTSSHITSLCKDKKGNLWVGTPTGLNLYQQGTDSFKRFTQSNNGLSSDYIQDILEDSKGNLWVATRGGLNRYDENKGYFEIFQKKDSPSMVSDNIQCLYEDRNKTLWVGYFLLDGLQKFDYDTKTFTTVLYQNDNQATEVQNPPPFNVTIKDIFEDSRGNFWLGTAAQGLILFDRNSYRYTTYKRSNNRRGELNTSTVWDIEEDEKGNLLVATEGGGLNILNLDSFDEKQPQFAHYQVEPLNAYSINDNFLQSIYKDKDGLIWIGSKDSGINKIDKGIQKFTHYQSNQIAGNNLTNKDVRSIIQDHVGNVWVGTADGLNRIDAERINIDYFFPDLSSSNAISSNQINTIYQDKDLDIWVGTDKGLNRIPFTDILSPNFVQYTQQDSSQKLSSNYIQCLTEDEEGNLWVGTNRGLNLINKTEESFQVFYNPKNEASNIIHCLLVDKKNRLWLGTEMGLVSFNLKKKQFTNYLSLDGSTSGLSNNYVHCLFEDANDALWIGTSEGLNKMTTNNESVQFESYTISSGLPDNTIYAIRGDRKGNLWLSTSAGLTRFNPRKNEFKNFTNQDGLQDGEFNSNASFKNWKGELFFGGSDGLNIFLPESLPLNQNKPPVILTNFEINYQPVPVQVGGQLEENISIADKVTLFPGDNRFSFEFVALNYTQSKKNAYAYKLENYDNTWQYPNRQNIAFYNNIDPGNYIFKVKAANNDGVWNEKGVSIAVIVKPTLFQTWYFRVGLFLTIVGISYLLYLNRVRSLRQRSATLEKMVKERTEQIESQNQQLESTVKTLKNTQAQLVVSEKMASLGQLTAGIAHEINNPINFISSNVQALKMDFQDMQNILRKVKSLEHISDTNSLRKELKVLGKKLDFELLEAEIGELLAGIERGTERTVNIVSSLRTFSRNSTDDFALANIHEGIDSTLTILNSQLNGHIDIEKKYGTLPPIRCQISRLNQVFLNIINNSIQAINSKSTGEKGIIIITTQRMGKKALISIKDNGNGMSESTQKRIFEPFYTTKDVGEGTGLGLSISYGIIEQHKGKIEVFSQLNKGTDFLIHLPIS